MIANVHQALAQVREIHTHLLNKQRFKGYSGRARALGGCVGLLAGMVLWRLGSYSDSFAVLVWTLVAWAGVSLNYGAVILWYLKEPEESRKLQRLKPAAEALPTLLVGAVLTFLFWREGLDRQLPAVWMLLFGLANWTTRHSLPRRSAWLGVYYLACGLSVIAFKSLQGLSNPWPMTTIFFVGEWAGALIFHFDSDSPRTLSSLFGYERHDTSAID